MFGLQTVIVAFLLVHLKNIPWKTHALTCLQCGEIFQPRHCHMAVQCTQDEYCALERTLNSQDEIVYNTGCRPKYLCDLQVANSNNSFNNACFECCETDLCNAQGCGEPGYPTKRGPVCYNCGPTGDLSTCRTVQACQGHEVCFTERNTEFSDTIYTSGCRDKHICYNQRSSRGRDGVRRKRFILSGNHEKECCTTDLCNAKGQTMITTSSGPSTRPTSTNLTPTSNFRPSTIYPTTNSTTTGTHMTSCLEILRANPSSKNGVYRIMLSGSNKSIDVFCDMETAGGGWIVFQRRVDASVDFYRNFSEYEAGFGSLSGNLWLGLHALYMLTRQNTTLRVDFTTAINKTYYAEYSQFYIDGAPLYTAHCRGYSGTAGDAISSSISENIDGKAFSTRDRDTEANCAKDYHGGWWYGHCYFANLNGQYGIPGQTNNYQLILWLPQNIVVSPYGSMKFVEMKVR